MKRAAQKKFHFLYKTTCIPTGRWYIGIHSTDDIDDGYLGSGRRFLNSLKRYGKDSHQREILEFCPNREFLCERERQVVTLQMITDPLCMNLVEGGASSMPIGQDSRERMRLAKLGKKQSPEHVEARRRGMMGRVQSPETREKLRAIAEEQWTRRRVGDEFAIGKRRSHG